MDAPSWKPLRNSSRSFVYAGTNAAESAPSPKSLRAKFGNKNAKKNAEETAPAPK